MFNFPTLLSGNFGTLGLFSNRRVCHEGSDLRLRSEQVLKPEKVEFNVLNRLIPLRPCPPRLGNYSEQNPQPCALGAALQAPAARLIGCIRRQNPPLCWVPGAPRSSPTQPQATGFGEEHLMAATLRRGIQRQKGDPAPDEEATLATLHSLGHSFQRALGWAS